MPLDSLQDCRRTNRIRIIRSRKSSIRLWRSYSNVKNLMILIRFVPCSLLTTGMCRWLSIRRNRRTKLNFWWSIVRNKQRNFCWLSKKGKLLGHIHIRCSRCSHAWINDRSLAFRIHACMMYADQPVEHQTVNWCPRGARACVAMSTLLEFLSAGSHSWRDCGSTSRSI